MSAMRSLPPVLRRNFRCQAFRFAFGSSWTIFSSGSRAGAFLFKAAYVGRGRSGAGAKDEAALSQGIGAEPICAVHADAGCLAGCVETRQGSAWLPVDVGVHAAHHVVDHGPYR